MSKIKIGGRLKALREEKGISQYQVAKDTGIIQKTISSYENNRSEPPLEILKKLAEYYKTSIDYIILGREKRKEEETKIRHDRLLDYLNKIEEIEEGKKKMIEEVVESILFAIENKELLKEFVKRM